MEQNQLQHFGVKGMKWGVRRSPDQLGTNIANKMAKYERKAKINEFKAIERKHARFKVRKKAPPKDHSYYGRKSLRLHAKSERYKYMSENGAGERFAKKSLKVLRSADKADFRYAKWNSRSLLREYGTLGYLNLRRSAKMRSRVTRGKQLLTKLGVTG